MGVGSVFKSVLRVLYKCFIEHCMCVEGDLQVFYELFTRCFESVVRVFTMF
jgi:hypothetical protein